MNLREIIEFCSRSRKDISTLMSEHAADLSWDELKSIKDEAYAALKELDELKSTLPETDSLHTAYGIYREEILDTQIRAIHVMKGEQETHHLAAVQLHDQYEDYYLTADVGYGFYGAASIYHNYIREEVAELTLDSIAWQCFTDHLMIDDMTFSILCKAFPYDEQLTELIKFDFEQETISVCEGDESKMRTYALKDVSAAVCRAEEKSGLSPKSRCGIFKETLAAMPGCMADEIGSVTTERVAESQRKLNMEPFTFKSLFYARLENVHLMHKDVEIELPHTIVELDENTLTKADREAWADVLNAKVTRIYNGYYGVQIELDGVKPSRLENFSAMLGGYCSVEDSENWVNEQKDLPEQQPQQEPLGTTKALLPPCALTKPQCGRFRTLRGEHNTRREQKPVCGVFGGMVEIRKARTAN